MHEVAEPESCAARVLSLEAQLHFLHVWLHQSVHGQRKPKPRIGELSLVSNEEDDDEKTVRVSS